MKRLAMFFGHIPTQGTEALLLHGLQAMLVLAVALWLASALRRAISRHMQVGGTDDARQIETYRGIATSIVLVPAVLVAIHILGINLTPLFATGGVLALAMGFGAREVAENLIAGVFLRAEKLAVPGSVLDIDGQKMTVKSLGLRATRTDSYDGRDLVIPNSDLLQSRIGTFTLSDSNQRISTDVRISHTVDRHLVRKVLLAVVNDLNWLADGTERSVTLKALTADAILYEIQVWVDSPSKSWKGLDALNEAIWAALSDNGIAFGVMELSVSLIEKSPDTQPGPVPNPR